MNTIQSLWEIEECPSINGLLYRDGTYFPYDVEVISHRQSHYTLRAVEGFAENIVQNVEHHWRFREAEWHSFYRGPELAFPGGTIVCGEGVLGSGGDIACENEAKQLEWIFFFEESNPFIALARDGDFILAKSNHRYLFRFQPDSPRQFTVIDP